MVVLAYDHREIQNFIARNPHTDIDRIFLWQGNARILISIVNYVEDKRNVLHDTRTMNVPVLLLVEDDITYYSLFLPVIYTEIISQSRRLLNEALNVAHKLVRMRARPKILLCSNYEEAEREVLKYREYLLGVISDVEFPRAGELTPEAGFELARMVRETVPDVPIVLQSSRTEFMERAHREGFAFLQKRSPTLLGDLRNILTEEMGFGDFVFRQPDGTTEVGARGRPQRPGDAVAHRAGREPCLSRPAQSLFALADGAHRIRIWRRSCGRAPSATSASLEHLRRDLIDSIAEYRREQSQALIGEYNPATFQPSGDILPADWRRLAGRQSARSGFHSPHPAATRHRAQLPRNSHHRSAHASATTEVFDRFLSDNDLLDFAIHSDDDAEITRRFLQASFPISLLDNLLAFLEARALSAGGAFVQPAGRLAVPAVLRRVRDVHAGQLLMLTSNCDWSNCWRQSSWCTPPPSASTPRLMCGRRRIAWKKRRWRWWCSRWWVRAHADRFYPDFSGVVRSRNFYPMGNITVADGFAAVALGIGPRRGRAEASA